MFIIGLGTAVPAACYSQRECWEALRVSTHFRELSVRSQAILRKVLNGSSGIDQRHLALEPIDEVFDVRPDALHARFARHAPLLAASAGAKAIEDAGIHGTDIEAVLVSTCTGYLCPGLTSYVVEALGLKANVLPLDFVGQGCAAALPNLMTAKALIGSGRCARVLSICVEVCSAAFYLDEDPGVLISACLFGDGAGAAVLSREPGDRRAVEWKGAASLTVPEDRGCLRFEQRNGMLRNVLAPQVPALAAAHAQTVLSEALKPNGLSPRDIAGWIFHPGGRDVLLALAEKLGIGAEHLRLSADVLRRYGNLSSPSVLFVLQEALRDSVPPGLWWMSAFGAGFSCHGALLQVR